MGQTTPNIGIYIPNAGETNYSDSFAAGMVNVDQHDHSGGPNKGVPIGSTGLADFSVTYNKLNANVVDLTTGIGVSGALPNQLQILGLLKNIYQLVTSAGFISKNGSAATARTFQSSGGQIDITNPDGAAGNPDFNLNASFYTSGQWTPTLKFGGGTTGITYSQQNGQYVRIGDAVLVNAVIELTNKGSSTGAATLEGFPIATVTNGGNNAFVMTDFTNLTLDAGYSTAWIQMQTASTVGAFGEFGSNQAAAMLTNTNFANNTSLAFSALYLIN
jgi:hypothetical protein